MLLIFIRVKRTFLLFFFDLILNFAINKRKKRNNKKRMSEQKISENERTEKERANKERANKERTNKKQANKKMKERLRRTNEITNVCSFNTK
jgi:uncharacterized membrane protein